MRRLFVVMFMVLMFGSIYAAFEDVGWTARSKAMGNAMFGDFGGVDSMNYNPATISSEKSFQFYGAWDNPYAGLNDGTMINVVNFNLVVPFFNGISLNFDPFFTKNASFGFSVHRISVADRTAGVEYYHEGIYSFIYAKNLNDIISRGANISAGVRLSLYDLGVGEVEDVSYNTYITGMEQISLGKVSFGLDVGLTYDFSETIRIGIAYKNLIAPSVSIFNLDEKMPTELRLGGNWNIGKIWFMRDFNIGFGFISYGRDADDNRQSDSSYNVGLEFEAITIESMDDELLAYRMGAIYQPKKNLEDIIEITGGLGFKYIFGKSHEISIDYAVEYSINMGVLQHTAGMTYQYHLPNSAFAYKDEVRAEMVYEELLKEQQEKMEDEESEVEDDTEETDSDETSEELKEMVESEIEELSESDDEASEAIEENEDMVIEEETVEETEVYEDTSVEENVTEESTTSTPPSNAPDTRRGM